MKRQQFVTFAQLVRLPAVFTVPGDVILGWTLTHSDWDVALLAAGLASSISLYWMGMVLNDFFDREQDAKERPQRPIPSGRVTARQVLGIGALLGVAGIIIAAVAGLASFLVAVMVVGCVLLYDGLLKVTVLGPLAMGACRSANILLGVSLGRNLADVFDSPQLTVAAGAGLYIAGVTLFGRREAAESHRGELIAGMVAIVAAFLGLGWVLHQAGAVGSHIGLLAFVGFAALVRMSLAVRDPQPGRIQMAVRGCLLSYVLLDAVLILGMTGNTTAAVGVALLVIPANFAGRVIPMT